MTEEEGHAYIQHRQKEIVSAFEVLKRQLPDRMIVLFVFEAVTEDGQDLGTLKFMRANIEENEVIIEAVTNMIANMRETEVVDLRDVQGGMQ